ncbi:putative membrane protein [Wickerhamomyces ciferrii]|uniref:Membrane protein n=1 Tax=Wickerhamomyces ciferrii (strain ATCC 14091 / BCRC 22168 / CBS 111 / JCM 3599 / NBRC 0793 / NRRL Y-1031 F-60-10) TaxID=1206466 RepID=K0KRP9_WICCF|nr:uncharacterized protein BN7_5352 [Wickerhamomyces ciferrii]CCH45766.1 putative membrane protein [Wickerhamomyces ciferrii]
MSFEPIKLILRGSHIGKIANRASGGKFFKHREDKRDYIIPEKYLLKPTTSSTNIDKEEKLIDTQNDSTGTKEYTQHREYILATWDGEDDPEHPHNWPLSVRIYVSFIHYIISLFTYFASANYTPGIEQLQEEFGINHVKATLPLSLFVFGYGMGPMILGPLSEHKSIGRNKIFIVTLFIFTILQIPTALAKNIA